MKGVVFTEFVAMTEGRFGLAVTDAMIGSCDLPSGGAYTSVGTYDHSEMIALVSALSRLTRIPAPELLGSYGHHLFERFVERYPRFFPAGIDCFAFLRTVDDHIHVEVLKLYPDAELPSFETGPATADSLTLTYRSCRPLGDLAEGLLRGCIDHFGEPIVLTKDAREDADDPRIDFHLRRTRH